MEATTDKTNDRQIIKPSDFQFSKPINGLTEIAPSGGITSKICSLSDKIQMKILPSVRDNAAIF